MRTRTEEQGGITDDGDASVDGEAGAGVRARGGVDRFASSDASDGQTQITTAPAVSHIHHTRGTMTVTLTITNDTGGGAATGRPINVLPCGRLGHDSSKKVGTAAAHRWQLIPGRQLKGRQTNEQRNAWPTAVTP